MRWFGQTPITHLGEDGAHVRQSSDRPMLKRALHIRHQSQALVADFQ
jgi:hypothetical protein